MPLKHGTSRKVISQNIREFKGGERYQTIKREHGAKTAHKAAVAAALEKARASGANIPERRKKKS